MFRFVKTGLLVSLLTIQVQSSVSFGIDTFSPNLTGTFENNTGDTLTFDKAYSVSDFSTMKNFKGWLDIKNPNSWLPSIKLEASTYNTNSQEHGDAGVQYFDLFGFQVQLDGSYDITSEINLKTMDVVLYYDFVLPSGIAFDIGVDAKWLEAKLDYMLQEYVAVESLFTITPDPIYGNEKVDRTLVPLLYCGIDIPFADNSFVVALSGSGIQYNGDQLYDIRTGVKYILGNGLGIEAGYQRVVLKTENLGNFKIDTKTDFVYYGLLYRF
jgi:hypothetical protein